MKVHDDFSFSWAHDLADTQKAGSESGSCKEESFEEESNTPLLFFVKIILLLWIMGIVLILHRLSLFQVIHFGFNFYCPISLIYQGLDTLFEVSTSCLRCWRLMLCFWLGFSFILRGVNNLISMVKLIYRWPC